MINFLAITSHLVSKHLLAIAEVALWAFVAIGVCRVLYHGINGISSLVLGTCLIFMGLSLAFYLFSFSCKLIVKSKRVRSDYDR